MLCRMVRHRVPLVPNTCHNVTPECIIASPKWWLLRPRLILLAATKLLLLVMLLVLLWPIIAIEIPIICRSAVIVRSLNLTWSIILLTPTIATIWLTTTPPIIYMLWTCL